MILSYRLVRCRSARGMDNRFEVLGICAVSHVIKMA